MSGAEAAGLVLGSIPLLISGLEHYGEGVRTIQRMRNSAKEFAKLRQALQCEQQIFLNCLLLLLRADLNAGILDALLQSAENSQTWSDPSVDQCLRRRLGQSYAPFVVSAQSMALRISEFKDALQLGQDGRGPFAIERHSVAMALRRIRFGLKMRAYVEMLNDISAHNKRLCQLTDQGLALEPLTTTRKRVPDFEKARVHAHEIFGTLQQSLIGSCSVGHRASLYMRPLDVVGLDRVIRDDASRFRIVLHHHISGVSGPNPPWLIEEAEIRPIDAEVDDEEMSQSQTGPAVQAVQTRTARGRPTRQAQSFAEIQDLCMSLKRLRISQSACDICLGYLSGPGTRCRHGLYWPNRPLIDQQSPQTLSLADVLDKNRRLKLGESDKRSLALALATGMLRLYNTPWLARQWGSREVLLFQRRGAIVAEHPFISAEIPASNVQDHATQRSLAYFNSCRLIKEETIFALGIMLIELALEQSFDTLSIAEDLRSDGTKHQLSDFCTADRLVDEVYLVAGERYANVVRRCIQCQFDEQKSSLASAPFRRKFYEGVIAELELELEDLRSL